MKLSEAIALGRTLIVGSPGDEYVDETHGCARGMALAAVGKRDSGGVPVRVQSGCFNCHPIPINLVRFIKIWPWTAEEIQPACECPHQFGFFPIHHRIAHLFDYHVATLTSPTAWTLDDLIAWVREMERKYATVEEERLVVCDQK